MAVIWKKIAFETDVITKALLTAEGDIIYASDVSTPAVLAHGDEGDVLTVASGVPDWAAPGAPAAHTLNSHTVPNGAVDFDLQQATDLVVFTVASEAAMAALNAAATEVGQLCFCTSEKTLHICTESSV